MCAGSGTEDSPRESGAFSRALTTLRNEGSNLLVVGSNHDAVRSQACQRFLGESVSVTRRRLFVRTERNTIVDEVMRELYTQTGPQSTTVVEQTNQFRSAAAQADSTATRIPRTTVSGGDLGGLADAIVDAIDEFEAAADGLEPAEFRLCFDSLRPLLADHSEEAVFRFLHVVTEAVTDVQGMAHYHLPLLVDSSAVDLVGPLFDAVVEVRIHDSYPQQRWHLDDGGVTTEWLPI